MLYDVLKVKTKFNWKTGVLVGVKGLNKTLLNDIEL